MLKRNVTNYNIKCLTHIVKQILCRKLKRRAIGPKSISNGFNANKKSHKAGKGYDGCRSEIGMLKLFKKFSKHNK